MNGEWPDLPQSTPPDVARRVREYVKEHPNLTPAELAAMIAKELQIAAEDDQQISRFDEESQRPVDRST